MSTDVSLGGCDTLSPNIIVCSGPQGIHRREVMKCWTCERRTPHVLKWDGAWYGTTRYCVVCLDGWVDGYRMERPFYRYWKRNRAAHIKELWDSALLPAEYKRWTRLDIHRAVCDDDTGDCAECAYGSGAS